MTAHAWGAFHQLRAGRRRIHRLRLVVEEVPAGVKRPELAEALELAGHVARCSDGGVPWANHTLLRADRWPPVVEQAPEDANGPLRLSWEALSAAQGHERQLTIPVSPALYSSITLAAAGAGLSIRAWCRRELDRASGELD